jgi:hypothetical protein
MKGAKETTMICHAIPSRIDLHANSLLAAAFSHPSEVLADPVLSTAEKRCVLAAWASDAFAVEGCPWLRQLPGGAEPIPVGDILAALRRLDHDDDPHPGSAGALHPPALEPPAMAVGF